jgi:DNA repair exonuclease SbcCD ATPase subunit
MAEINNHPESDSSNEVSSEKGDTGVGHDNITLKIDDAYHQLISGNTGISAISAQIYSSSDELGGTIAALSSTIKKIEDDTYARLEPNVSAQIAANIEPIKAEIASLKEINSQLENTKSSLGKVEKFINDNKNSFLDLITAEGKYQRIESDLSSIRTRVEKIEGSKNISWNRTSAIISILIAAIVMSFSCLSLTVSLYVAFFK